MKTPHTSYFYLTSRKSSDKESEFYSDIFPDLYSKEKHEKKRKRSARELLSPAFRFFGINFWVCYNFTK